MFGKEQISPIIPAEPAVLRVPNHTLHDASFGRKVSAHADYSACAFASRMKNRRSPGFGVPHS